MDLPTAGEDTRIGPTSANKPEVIRTVIDYRSNYSDGQTVHCYHHVRPTISMYARLPIPLRNRSKAFRYTSSSVFHMSTDYVPHYTGVFHSIRSFPFTCSSLHLRLVNYLIWYFHLLCGHALFDIHSVVHFKIATWYLINHFPGFRLLPRHVVFGCNRQIVLGLIILMHNWNSKITFYYV